MFFARKEIWLITLKRSVYNLEKDFTFPFEMKEGTPCVYSRGVWTAEKMKSLRAAPDAMVHVSTLGRYQHPNADGGERVCGRVQHSTPVDAIVSNGIATY